MRQEQKYGKLAQSDIEQILPLLPQLEKVREEFQALVHQQPEDFSERFLTTGFAWAHLYEVPFLQLLLSFVAVAGLDKDIARATSQEEPIKTLLGLLDDSEDMVWAGGSEGKFTPGDFLGCLHAIIGNLDCLVIYGSYLNDLISDAKKGDLEALYKAIRIDPTVVTGTYVRNLISFEVITGGRGFIDVVRKAMAGKTGGQAAYLKKLRFLMQLLHEAGALGLPTKDISDLVFKVGAYERSPTAAKNVSELILKAKALKKNAISK